MEIARQSSLYRLFLVVRVYVVNARVVLAILVSYPLLPSVHMYYIDITCIIDMSFKSSTHLCLNCVIPTDKKSRTLYYATES